MRRHDLNKKNTMAKTKTKTETMTETNTFREETWPDQKKTMTNTKTMTKTNTFKEHLQRATLATCDI